MWAMENIAQVGASRNQGRLDGWLGAPPRSREIAIHWEHTSLGREEVVHGFCATDTSPENGISQNQELRSGIFFSALCFKS